MEDRIQRATQLFKSGYNCSQSVVAAFADLYGFTHEQALHISASFGGGIGRMRLFRWRYRENERNLWRRLRYVSTGRTGKRCG